MPAAIKEKKSKAKQFTHAKDNAVSALGKIIRYQTTTIDAPTIIPGWLSLLPIKNDVEEAKIQNEILASLLEEAPQALLGDQYQRFEQVVLILGEILDKKYVENDTGAKLARFIK
jgi:endoglucanase Acf2